MMQRCMWRHNNVLKVLEAGLQPYSLTKKIRIDVNNGTKTLPKALGNMRPDLVVTSGNMIAIAELTCSLPKNMAYWRRVKIEKYMPIMDAARHAGWRPSLWTLEVSSDGEYSESFSPFLCDIIGMPERSAIELANDCGMEALLSTRLFLINDQKNT